MKESRLGPRKVLVGTTMHNMFVPYPGLQARLQELASLVDSMAQSAVKEYPNASLDIAVLPENAVNGGKEGDAKEVSYPLEGDILEVMGACARRNRCYIVVPLYLVDNREQGLYSNAAALLDREGNVAGIYRKVFTVLNPGEIATEGGVTPGKEFPVFECDFGKVGIQICYDMAFDEGWETLKRKGAELIVWPTQWPGQINPAARALHGKYFVLSSTWRNNASLLDPTGHLICETRQNGVFVAQIDLDYVLLHWQPTLLNGKAFDTAFGERAGYRYSEAEDGGIFWSNDPALPITEMVRMLGFEEAGAELARCHTALETFRGGAPSLC